MNHYHALTGVTLYGYGTLATVGQKAANLVRLSALLPTETFTIPTGLAIDVASTKDLGFPHNPGTSFRPLIEQIRRHLGPRLVVRSSPLISAPGLLDTVIDIANGDTRALHEAMVHVINSWFKPEAIAFRTLYRQPQAFGMGLLIQDYVAPELNSFAGVHFTRHPQNGNALGYTEAVRGMNGQALVGGLITPVADLLPAPTRSLLCQVSRTLEGALDGPLDVEFVVTGKTLHIVQARPLRHLPAHAAVRAAREMVREGLISTERGTSLVSDWDSKAPWWLAVDSFVEPVSQGLGAVSGAICGRVAITDDFGKDAIYVGGYTDTTHIADMLACAGILTNTGGRTCHAALLAMQAGLPTIAGAHFSIDEETITFPSGIEVKQGEWITIDGNSGAVYLGKHPIIDQRHAQ